MANEFPTRNDEIVDGLYRLGALINRSIRSTVYKTEFGEDGLPAAIKIREYESPGSEELMERWRNAMELSHPNLLKIYATGSSALRRPDRLRGNGAGGRIAEERPGGTSAHIG